MRVIGLDWTFSFFFFNDTATTEIYTLSLHDALPICHYPGGDHQYCTEQSRGGTIQRQNLELSTADENVSDSEDQDRKSTRLNSSHLVISYAVFCLKKKKRERRHGWRWTRRSTHAP